MQGAEVRSRAGASNPGTPLASPLLRFRIRDYVEMWTNLCACGRTMPRVRCIGRADDMLVVRGVNLFPSAIHNMASAFAPEVGGFILMKPGQPGVKQEPPLLVAVELSPGVVPGDGLDEAIAVKIRNLLLVQVAIGLMPAGSLPWSEYKSKLVNREGGVRRDAEDTEPGCSPYHADGS